MQTVLVEVATKGSFDLSCVQILDDISDSFALAIPLKDFTNDDCFIFINIEGVVRSGLEAKTGIAAVG